MYYLRTNKLDFLYEIKNHKNEKNKGFCHFIINPQYCEFYYESYTNYAYIDLVYDIDTLECISNTSKIKEIKGYWKF
jgi:hypothetical protein